MYTREAYPGNPGVLFHYSGSDPGYEWPLQAPSGITLAEGYVKIEPVTFSPPGSSEEHRLTTDETIYLAGMSVGLPYEVLAERYPYQFRRRGTTTADLQAKFGVDAHNNKGVIANSFYQGVYSTVAPAILTHIRPDRRQTLVDINRLVGAGYTVEKAAEMLGEPPPSISVLTRYALRELDLSFIINRPNALLTAFSMGGLILQFDQDEDPLAQLPPLTDKEIRSAFPTETLAVQPAGADPSVVITIRQHPKKKEPDWQRGKVERFSYRNAVFKIGEPEKAGLNNLEVTAWVLRCAGLRAESIASMIGSSSPLRTAQRKLAPDTMTSAPEGKRRMLLPASVINAREQGLLIPCRKQPQTHSINRALLLDTAELFGTCATQEQISEELRERGHTVSERILRGLRRSLRVSHDGQLALLAEAVRPVSQDS